MKNQLKWLIVAGARPNFMKIAPLIKEIEQYNSDAGKGHTKIISFLVHTGQHYDDRMSKIFFEDLGVRKPDINLGIGSGGHGEQTGKIMIAFENIILANKPDLVIVVGDVNSTIACAMVATKLHIPVAHIEAGLRSFDRSMPEEINRILTDQISDFLFTHSPDANDNLIKEGISREKIFFVGNIMIDSLKQILPFTSNSTILKKLNGFHELNDYALLTLHRPVNVDNKDILKKLINCFSEISTNIPILFPVHPRTKKQIMQFGLEKKIAWTDKDVNPLDGKVKNRFYGLPPLGYLDFISLMNRSNVVFTDSGGAQEETTIMGIPCITLREKTERPITLVNGTNVLVGNVPDKIKKAFENAIATNKSKKRIPKYWDGKTAKRIVSILSSRFNKE